LEYLYDPIRNCKVLAYPEEIVRQRLLREMIDRLHYPKTMLGVEREIETLPHLMGRSVSAQNRRIDLICFAKGIHPDFSLYPLLIIECKAHPLSQKVVEQVVGYNHEIGAYFIAIANADMVKTLWYDTKQKKLCSIDYLPSYEQLLQAIQ
jgi:hypothetical protein